MNESARTTSSGQSDRKAPAIKHQPRSKRYYFDVGIGSVCLSGADTGGTYCLLEAGLAPGMSVPRLLAPRDIPHQLRNSGNVENHYLLMFSPPGFEEFLTLTAVPAPDNAAAPTKPAAISVQNVHELATDFGILFGGDGPAKRGQERETHGTK